MAFKVKYVRNVRSHAVAGSHILPTDFCTICYRETYWWRKKIEHHFIEVVRYNAGPWMEVDTGTIVTGQEEVTKRFNKTIDGKLLESAV